MENASNVSPMTQTVVLAASAIDTFTDATDFLYWSFCVGYRFGSSWRRASSMIRANSSRISGSSAWTSGLLIWRI